MSAVEREITRAETQTRRGWEVRRSKYIWREVINLSKDGSEQLLSVSQYDGVRPASEASRSESLKGYKIVETGDLVINIMLAWMGGLGVSEYDGIVSPAYAVYKPIAQMEPRFLHYLYRTRRYLADFARHSTGVVPSRWRMYSDDFGQVITELPPLPEQKEIVVYLDAETGRIDKAIAAEEKMIALLQERREIVINEAVGGGDLSHAEAQRGRERRGWEVRRLSQVILSLRTGLNPRRFFELNPDNATNYYVTIRELRDGKIVFSKDTDRINDQALSLCKNRSRLEKGDILFSGTGSIGEVALVRESPTNWNIKEGIYALKPNCKRIHTKYLVYVLVSPAFLALARARAVGTAVRSIPMKDLAILPIPLPPLPEQEAIVERLDRETGKIDRAIEVKQRQIELLRERRQIVIDEAVTGKVKVA